jgi:hypothetical protein
MSLGIPHNSIGQKMETSLKTDCDENMKTIYAYQLHVELEKINNTIDCILDTAIANHLIHMSV